MLEKGNLTDERQGEIINAFTVGEEPVCEVMTDREDTVFLSSSVSIDKNFDRIGKSPHTRFPLIGDDPSDFRGTIYVPAVVDRIDELREGEATLADIAAEPMRISADMAISKAGDRFQEEHQELALVYDEAAEHVVGLITARDALEAVMGGIKDPLDIKPREQTAASRCDGWTRVTRLVL